MNLKLITALVFTSLVASAMAHAEEARKAGDNPKAVLPHSRRMEALKKADELLAIHPAGSEELVAELADPFYPGTKRSKDKKPGAGDETKVLLSDAQQLARAAELIRPQGTVVMGSSAYLQMVDGKFCKVGDPISVNIDGLDVQVTVSSIERNSYTLRLNDQELRREFK